MNRTPVQRRIEALLIAAAALAIVAVVVIALNTSPWLVLLLVGIVAFGIWMCAVSGLSGSP
jgi:hypothetical protein